jgi:hypothetical protein
MANAVRGKKLKYVPQRIDQEYKPAMAVPNFEELISSE